MLRLTLVIFMVAACSVPAAAQVLYGSLTGTVQDSGGAVVPGAKITARNTGTAQELTTLTNDIGAYTFTNLVPGA